MRGFPCRAEVNAVRELVIQRTSQVAAEPVDVRQAADRVLACDIVAEVAVPGFDRAAMDGYALIAGETFGAGTYNPVEMAVIGAAFPGRPFSGSVGPGQAVRIMTGAPVPSGADAVVPAENAAEANVAGRARARITEPVPPGRHVGKRGEDIDIGQVVLRAGRRLRPQDVAVLASLGVAPVPVIRRPTLAILVTGDELLPPGSRPEGYCIVDSNSVMLEALARRDGAAPPRVGMVADGYETVRTALAETVEDVVLVSGGSSVGQEDQAPGVLAELGELAVHGVALRPASPTGLGFLNGRPVFLLPGNPVSCLCAYDLFAGPAVRRLGGRPSDWPYNSARLPLARKIASAVGRVDYVRVQVKDGKVEPLAISGAAILSSTTRADGFVLVPADSEGHGPGELVEVFFYDTSAKPPFGGHDA